MITCAEHPKGSPLSIVLRKTIVQNVAQAVWPLVITNIMPHDPSPNIPQDNKDPIPDHYPKVVLPRSMLQVVQDFPKMCVKRRPG